MSANEAYLSASLEWLRSRLNGNCVSPPEVPGSTAMARLADLFGLSPFEQQTLLLCAALELDPNMAGLCARAQGNPAMPWPTFALAITLFDDPAWDTLSPQRPLRLRRLVEVHQAPGQPLTASPLRADERIVSYLKGLNYLDERLSSLLFPLPAAGELSREEREAAERIAQSGAGVVQLTGAGSPSKAKVARRAAELAGLDVLQLPSELLPVQAAETDNFARLWERERRLLGAALYLDLREDSEALAAPVQRLLLRAEGLMFLDTREPLRLRRAGLTLDFENPAPWRQVSNGNRPRLDALAQRIVPLAKWEDIVLPPEPLALLRRIAAQVRGRRTVYEEWGFAGRMNRGLGVTALFAGESGTGKTMAAEVLANELHLDLWRIDLSSVVSKYIGETEKNLRRVFDAVEDSGGILFFDEADALFGKRSEVRDSHDRYANIEINYLLQRMESYRGLAILATNMKSALDPAFLRRLRFVVEFAFPGSEERRRIWERIFPSETPTRNLDLERLSRLNLTGGAIHNIALSAAFLAADAGSPVTMPLILEAARSEFRKLERPVDESLFRV